MCIVKSEVHNKTRMEGFPVEWIDDYIFNPILTGGGGQFDPPPRTKSATASDRDTPFH